MSAILLLLCLVGLARAQISSAECADYCMSINDVCTGTLAQFPDPMDDMYNLCMNSCTWYPDNSTLSTSGDSYQCRMYHIGLANQSAANAQIHCWHAGFNGGPGICGSFCQAYCDNIMAACQDGNLLFADRAQCMQECAYYPVDANFNLSSTAVATGNSVNCRAWHSQVALNNTGNGITAHCGHASPQGGQYCGSDCENYCDNVMAVCTDSFGLRQWTNRNQCLAACMTWPEQNDTATAFQDNLVTSGNSLPCRKYHASVAGQSISNSQTHCIHTGPLGGSGVCGSECEGLCNLAVAACDSIDETDCMDMCAMLADSEGTNTTLILKGKVAAGTTGCATYYALSALSNPNLCTKLSNALNMTDPTGDCISAAVLLKASWSMMIVALLVGFIW